MTETEKKLLSIIKSLINGVIDESDSHIRREVRDAVSEVRDLGISIASPLDGEEDEEENE